MSTDKVYSKANVAFLHCWYVCHPAFWFERCNLGNGLGLSGHSDSIPDDGRLYTDFYATGLVILYAVNAGANAMMQCESPTPQDSAF